MIAQTYLAEEGTRWKPRSRSGFRYLLAAFEDEMRVVKILRPSQLNSETISAWVERRQSGDDKVTNATINRTLALVRRMLRWASRRKPPLCPASPLDAMPNLREVKRGAHPTIPSPAEWSRLVAELAAAPLPTWGSDERRRRAAVNARGLALFVATAVQTGMRLDELRHLRDEDLDADAVHVRAWGDWSPKSYQERTIPCPSSVIALAREMVAWKANAKGLNGEAVQLGEHWINDRLDEAWARAKLPEGEAARMHDARRTFATELVRAGQPLTVVRDRMGHRDVQTTERYLGRYRSDREREVPDFGVGRSLVAAPAEVIPMKGRERRS